MQSNITKYHSGICSAAKLDMSIVGYSPHFLDATFRGKMRKTEVMIRKTDTTVNGRICPDWERLIIHAWLLPLRDGFETLSEGKGGGETRIGVYKLYTVGQVAYMTVGDHIKCMDRFWRVRNFQNFALSNYHSYTLERIPDFTLTGELGASFRGQMNPQ